VLAGACPSVLLSANFSFGLKLEMKTILASPLSGKFAQMMSIFTAVLMWTSVIFDVWLRTPIAGARRVPRR
jgi:hypothetical protein